MVAQTPVDISQQFLPSRVRVVAKSHRISVVSALTIIAGDYR